MIARFNSANKWGFRNRFNNEKITLADFLELLDGVVEMDGRIIIMTTNKRDKMDSALVRPGRIDLDLELRPPSRALIVEIFAHMYKHEQMDHLKEIFERCYEHIPDNMISTAKVINCFMYTKPEYGVRALMETIHHQQGDIEGKHRFTWDDDHPTESKSGTFNDVWNKAVTSLEKMVDPDDTNHSVDPTQNVDIYGILAPLIHTDNRLSKEEDYISIAASSHGAGPRNARLLNAKNTDYFSTTWDSTQAHHQQWIVVCFKKHALRLHKYVLKVPTVSYGLYSWDLEGSCDGIRWTLLSTHKCTLANSTFDVSCSTFYNRFRVITTGSCWNYAYRRPELLPHFSILSIQLIGEVKTTDC